MKNLKGIVFFDVDGTLVDYKNKIYKPSEKTKEAIRKLRENGYLTMLATGRPMSFVDEALKDLNFDGYIASNGTYIELDGKEVINNDIKIEKLREIVDYCDSEGISFILEGQKTSYAPRQEVVDYLVNTFGIPNDRFTIGVDGDEISANKLVIIDNEKENFKNIFDKYDGEFVFMQHPGANSYDMYRVGCTKGCGIAMFIKEMGFQDKPTYAFGDGENDIEMFQTVKYGIAMGDAHDRLLPYAYKQTENVPNEGVYKGLLELGLIK